MFPRSRRIVRPEVAGGHPDELEHDRNDVGGRDEAPHEPALQPPVRKRQKDVQEENRRQQVERLPKRVQDVSARPGQRRKEVDEPGDDQQRAQHQNNSAPSRVQPPLDPPVGRPSSGGRPYRRSRPPRRDLPHEEATPHLRSRVCRVAARPLRRDVRNRGQVMLPLMLAVPLALLPFLTLLATLRRMATASAA